LLKEHFEIMNLKTMRNLIQDTIEEKREKGWDESEIY